MKQNVMLLLLFLAINVQSQSLDRLISKESKAVVEVSGDQIFSLISNTDLEGMFPPGPNGEAMDLNQFGFDINTKAYYFLQQKDSITYQNVVVKLSDVQKAEETISGTLGAATTKVHGYEFVNQENMTAAWNSTTAIFTYADFPKKVYTIEDILEEKRQMRSSEEESDEANEDEEVRELEGDMDLESLEYELMFKNMSAPYLVSSEEMVDMMKAHFSSIIDTDVRSSVRSVSSYSEGKAKKSSAYFWVNNISKIMTENFGGEMMAYMPTSSKPELSLGITDMTGNLIFDKDEIKLSTEMTIEKDLVESYKKMYSSKMDKAFFNYFDANDIMGYMSFTMDMTAVMKEYPNMVTKMYGSMLPDFNEEIDVATDILSVVLDEEAIGELITGDGMILIHDVEGHEVTYKTFEYDDDYNATEVEKTKIEQMPTFSLMMGSKNKRIIDKLMKLTKKYEVAEQVGGRYKILSKSMGAPFDIYFTYNDGIAFLSNSMERIAKYELGSKVSNLGTHKNILKNNMFNMYVNTSKTMEKLASINMVPAEASTVDYVMNNYKEFYMTMGDMKDDKIGYDMVFKTNESKGNALKLILDTMNELKGAM